MLTSTNTLCIYYSMTCNLQRRKSHRSLTTFCRGDNLIVGVYVTGPFPFLQGAWLMRLAAVLTEYVSVVSSSNTWKTASRLSGFTSTKLRLKFTSIPLRSTTCVLYHTILCNVPYHYTQAIVKSTVTLARRKQFEP